MFDGDRLLVGIEIGALLVSKDFGESFTELVVDPDPVECDIHRVLVHPDRPHRLIVANGIVGVMSSDDDGATWRKNPMPPHADYPDAIVVHPDAPDTVFLTAGVGWPSHWYEIGKARGKIARSRDGGNTWQRLLGGLPNGQRALFSALTIEAWPGGSALYAVDTDGEVFESTDEGDNWTIIAEVPPVSKGEFYRALARDRGKLGGRRYRRQQNRQRTARQGGRAALSDQNRGLNDDPIFSIWPANGKPTWPGKTSAPVDAQSSSTRRRLTRASSTFEFFGKFQSG